MAHGERCLLVHGHFYQPPRENPWTGRIDPQHSAAPWENWNSRIADECYLPMARSRLHGPDGDIEDLYNNYAHTSFNFGPTLLSWAEQTHPGLIRHLADAAVIDRTFAMAQAYNHMMLPLADARDRHTQIVWGLREFRHRFGFIPEGMWLSECGIDPETVRALIDHGIRFVILSPHQASKARPFGQSDWHDVSMGGIDTRRAYRLFEIDGGGRTHFDRHLDVVFYTPGLNLKVSFDHILNRPDDLKRELENCYGADADGAQIVSIVTDGEIYGHHEKHGEEALSRLYSDIAPALGLRVVSAGEFVRDNPPGWEVKLWNGEDNRGSSWSCRHGVGRWFRDCGCTPSASSGWNQRWRGPVRDAFDALRERVRFVTRRELGALVWDVDDARDEYVSVILNPAPETRRDFLTRHAQRDLTLEETGKLWRLLESLRNAMLMYSSCGWFFDEVSGLEPVQNMRYALRAAELAQPRHDENLTALLEEKLAFAESNIKYYGDGAEIFRKLVLPSRRDNRELAAAMAVCLAAGFPAQSLSWKLVRQSGVTASGPAGTNGTNAFRGAFVCLDECLDVFIRASWTVRLDNLENTIVMLHSFEEMQGDPSRSPEDSPPVPDIPEGDFATANFPAADHPDGNAGDRVHLDRLPEAVRGMVYRRFSGEEEQALLADAANLGMQAVPFMRRARKHGAQIPEPIVKAVTGSFERQMARGTRAAIKAMQFGDEEAAVVERARGAARELGLNPSQDACRRAVFLAGMELVARLARPERTQDALIRLQPLSELLEFADRLGLDPKGMTRLGMEYWDFLDKPLARLFRASGEKGPGGDTEERLLRIGTLLGFARQSIKKRLEEAIQG